MTRTSPPPGEPRYAAVAVPVPLPEALTYEIPPALLPLARPGVRVRVRVGNRRLTGVLIRLQDRAPEGFKIRPLDEVVDAEPLLPPDLLELAAFTAEYYLAPVGEVLRALLPSDLPAWGQRRVSLTNAGALAPPRSDEEAQVIEALREAGSLTLAQLQLQLGQVALAPVVEGLIEAGRLRSSDARESGSRYLAAYELAPGDLEAQRQACGRSPAGRSVVELLAALGRPATAAEIEEKVGCGPSVLRRLVSLGVLRRFTQIENLSLGHHVLRGRAEPPFELRPDQAAAVAALREALEARSFTPFLLRGMTGAGKTEVYLRALETVLEQGRSAILLVPEIALVPALGRAVQERFGGQLALLHSALSAAERRQEWERIRRGEAKVVVGPRSAVFAPVTDLGLVVVDEEQDPAYKQEVQPRYNGRDLALVRGQKAGAAVLLVSATPALESRHNAAQGKYRTLRLTARAGQGRLPEGVLVDLRRQEKAVQIPAAAAVEDEKAVLKPGELIFSHRLRVEIENTLAVGSQVILLRNRRGYAPLLLCRACGEDHRCEECGLPRTYHRRENCLVCHYCGSTRPVPVECGKCGESVLEPIGTGTERLEEQFKELFPDVAVDVLDRDVVRRKGGVAAVLERFRQGRTRVLVGTQMVSKGHHFPEVALTAVMQADTYLGFPDFRAVERTYNLLTQLAGRAGRGEVPGKVVIQTYHPEHYAIRAALEHDDEGFAAEEMRFRRIFHYPPYTRMIQLLLRDSDRQRGRQRMADLARRLAADRRSQGVRVSGPAPAPLERIRGKWRFQLLLRARSGRQLHDLVQAHLPQQPDTDLTVDVDPQDLL